MYDDRNSKTVSVYTPGDTVGINKSISKLIDAGGIVLGNATVTIKIHVPVDTLLSLIK